MCTHKKEASINEFSFRNSLCELFFRLLAPTEAKQLCYLNIKVSERHLILTLCYLLFVSEYLRRSTHLRKMNVFFLCPKYDFISGCRDATLKISYFSSVLYSRSSKRNKASERKTAQRFCVFISTISTILHRRKTNSFCRIRCW